MTDYQTLVIYDYDDNEVKVGSHVCIYDDAPAVRDEDGSNVGTVVSISDFDGDVDDDTGRSIVIPPTVTVEFHGDGTREEFSTSEWEHDYYDYDDEGCPNKVSSVGKVEELVVVMTSEDQKKFATYIIELDEDLKVNPDETQDRMEDVRSWALDLAKTIIDPEQEKLIRERIEREIEVDE